MKPRILLLCVLLLPILATAEIYKWRDTNGVIRYSDVPPPSNIKQESMSGKKLVTPTGQAPLAEVEGDATVAINKLKADDLKKVPPTKEEAAAKRAKEAEENKKLEAQKKAELEIKQDNCKNAKSRLATYTNGGRITKTDENGQKVFLGDAEIAKGRVEAQSDVDSHCN